MNRKTEGKVVIQSKPTQKKNGRVPRTRYTATLRDLEKVSPNVLEMVKGVRKQLGDGPFEVEEIQEVEPVTAALWKNKHKVRIDGTFYIGSAFDLHKICIQ